MYGVKQQQQQQPRKAVDAEQGVMGRLRDAGHEFMGRLRLLADSTNVRDWGGGYLLVVLFVSGLFYLISSTYYLVGSFRFRDPHFGVWNIAFLASETLLFLAYMVPFMLMNRWYNLWDKRLRSSVRDVFELNFSLFILVPTIIAIQATNLALYGIIQDVDVDSATLMPYRITCNYCGVISVVLLFVTLRSMVAYWHTAAKVARLQVTQRYRALISRIKRVRMSNGNITGQRTTQ